MGTPTGPTADVRLLHDTVFYRSDEELSSALVPWLREGLQEGAGLAVATPPVHVDLLRRALGPDAEHVA